MENQKFTFNCPHCGQPLEAETDWVGLECDCIYCGKPLIVPKQESAKGRLFSSADSAYRVDAHCPVDVPKTPLNNPSITVMSRPNPIHSDEQSQHQANKTNFWKRIPKWAYAASCVAVLVIVCLVSILAITGRKRNDDMHSHAKNEEQSANNIAHVSTGKISEARAVYDVVKMVNATLAGLYDDNANLIGDAFKIYALLEKEEDKGFQQAEVAIAHLLWAHEEVRNAKFGHSAMWLIHLQHAAKVLNSPLAKSEYGFFLINHSLGDMGRGNREEGWKLIQTAAKEGSISAKTFVEMIAEQRSSSHLSLDYLLQINGNNEDVLEPLMKQCCLELRMEFLRLQKECALRLKELMSDD